MLVACVALPAGVSAAAPYQTHGVGLSTFASGFATVGNRGPLGVAVDSANRLYVSDWKDESLYRFSTPGTASPSTRVGSGPVGGALLGLAFDASGHLYGARHGAGDVVQLDPNTGQILRTVATGIPCAGGIAVDPTSGDLFVTEPACTTGQLVRIQNPGSATPTVSAFGGSFNEIDGITIAPDGTLYVADDSVVERIAGPSSATPGQRTVLATLTEPDGVALGMGSNGKPAYLIVNRNGGEIDRVDLTVNPAAVTPLVTGGTRGDFVAVGFDGCLYATQTDSVIKLTNTDGGCGPGTGLGTGLAPTTPAQSSPNLLPTVKGCLDTRKFKFKLHHANTTTVVRVLAFVNGKLRLRKSGKNIK